MNDKKKILLAFQMIIKYQLSPKLKSMKFRDFHYYGFKIVTMLKQANSKSG
jgi:hypothetical protein